MFTLTIISLVICGILFIVDVMILMEVDESDRFFVITQMIGFALAIAVFSLLLGYK